MPYRILIADDEPPLLRSLGYAFRREGYEVDAVTDGAAALAMARAGGYDVAILDTTMPALAGVDVWREIRFSDALVVILQTARAAGARTERGLEACADGYVRKPFSVADVIGRVGALLLLRRLDIDLSAGKVVVDGREITLTMAELELLVLLASARGQVFTRRSIMEHLGRMPLCDTEHGADALASSLRQKLERHSPQSMQIMTERGVGYALASHPRGQLASGSRSDAEMMSARNPRNRT